MSNFDALTRPMPTAEARPHLIVLYPQTSFRQIPLMRGKSVIGRGTEADIRLEDEMISRKHSEISWDGTKITLRDLDSTNGTFVDGVALTTHPKMVFPENRLQIGKMVLKIDFKEPSDEAFDREFFEAATTDPLTKAPNRRTFIDRSVGELASARRKNQYVHVVLCQVDHFKKLCEDWGNSTGDMVLKSLSQIFTRNKRESDLFARYSNEEFILMLPEMAKADAIKSAERLRSAVESYKFSFNDKPVTATVSLGVASSKGREIPTLDAMVSKASQCLYYAKEQGQSQIVHSDMLQKA
ncbi:MAG: GGDEF domain-containing protein [Fibrobacter sp.]|nr:GGDEF domain-containing protein [Fibrobacter sp.]